VNLNVKRPAPLFPQILDPPLVIVALVLLYLRLFECTHACPMAEHTRLHPRNNNDNEMDGKEGLCKCQALILAIYLKCTFKRCKE
jgi:hypothetical protein